MMKSVWPLRICTTAASPAWSATTPWPPDYALQNEKYKDKLKIAAVIETGEVEYYGIAVNKGNKDVLDLVNKGIAAVKAKGYDKELLKKWIGQ